MGDTDPREHVRRVTEVFDQVADGHDGPALRYFLLAADRLALKLWPAPGLKVLDVCAGTGTASLALAPDALASFRAAHLAEVESKAGADGLWIDAAVHFARGIRPGRKMSGI